MIRLALSSAALLSAQPGEVIKLAAELRLDGIEWAGDPHVPEGDEHNAWNVLMDTLRAGLTVAAYAPLYRVSPRGEAGLEFSTILATAHALSAPLIRIYAGYSPRPTSAERSALLDELKRIADLAGKDGISLVLSLGRRTFFDRYSTARDFVAEAAHPFLRLDWEPLYSVPAEEATGALRSDIDSFALIHARRSDREGRGLALSEEAAAWRERLDSYANRPGDHGLGRFVVIGRLGEGDAERLREDAAFLRGLAVERG